MHMGNVGVKLWGFTCEPAHEALVGACEQVHRQVGRQAARDGLQESRLERGWGRLLRDCLPDVHEVRLRQLVHTRVLPILPRARLHA